jgi:tRNA(fMet)-specific endonuclease VapC
VLLLDANVCIDVLRGRPDVVTRLADHGPAGLFLCTVVKAELAYGARLAQEPERAAALVDAFCEPFPSLAFDDGCIPAYADLRARLRADGAMIGAMIGANDLAIASIALTHGLRLVSDDRAAFAPVPWLEVVSWRDG